MTTFAKAATHTAQKSGSCAPKVKFCGLSHVSDIAAVNEAAPEYVGFVFWSKSKRAVDAERAKALRDVLDNTISTVGVFVDEDVAVVASLLKQGIISIAQLHGTEDDAYIARLRDLVGRPIEVWKAFEVHDPSDVDKANASCADLVLLDGGKGEGNAFPWELLGGMTRPYALAGGLSPENIEGALERCAPVIVDVSSGIECKDDPVGSADSNTPHKDAQAMRSFMDKVRG